MVNVSDNRTWLGVLEGKVKLVSKIHPLKDSKGERIATYVASGQKAVTRTYSYPTVPELFSEKEWCTVQELYQLTEAPQIMLLIGTGPDRIDELLRPAPVYIPDIKRGSIPEPIERQLDAIMDTVQAGSGDAIRTATRRLEDALKEYPRSEYSVDILMFIGSHYSFVHNYDDALRIFAKVMEEYPDSAYASLAQCAIATIYQKDLKNIEKAEQTYRELLQAYPDSVDAIRARENLTSLR
jgi:tetratricopeptide (TPR) repeat protein